MLEGLPAAELDASLALIVRRAGAKVDEVADAMVERYRHEIVDYAAVETTTLDDVREISLENLRALLDNVERGELLRPAQLEHTRRGAARRVHQGVSLDSLLHAYRLWGRMAWEAILDSSRPERRNEREAALKLAGRVIEHIDLVSVAVAQAYVAEAQGLWSDHEVMRRDLLETLLSGAADAGRMQREAASLRLALHDCYIVVVARLVETAAEARPPLRLRAALRHAVDLFKRSLKPAAGSLLVGVRHGEIVALYPADGPASAEVLKAQCGVLARALATDGFAVGIGSWHPDLSGVASSYSEARDAVARAHDRGRLDDAVAFDEIIVDHILGSSRHADRVLADALAPMREYDQRRKAGLTETLRAYFESGYNIRRTGDALSIHPNTVVYRLRRIHELTGRDPHDPEDLLILVLGLRRIGQAPPPEGGMFVRTHDSTP